MTFILGPEHIAAQMAATLAFANLGANGHIKMYLENGTLQTDTLLANPCGVLAAGVLTLTPASQMGTMILVSGTPSYAEWRNGEGNLVARGTVSDSTNAGDFRIAGSATASGATSPTLYAGGLLNASGLTFT